MKTLRTVAPLFLSMLYPAIVGAQEVTTNLSGVAIPVGPAGTTVLRVERYRLQDTRYAVIRSRSTTLPSRCAVAAERVSVWAQTESRWTELANEVFDRCPRDARTRAARHVRAFMNEVQTPDGPAQPELWVQLLDARTPAREAPLVRFHRVGDRFVRQHVDTALASAPGAMVSRTLSENAAAQADGSVSEWLRRTPFATNDRGQVWLATKGSSVHFAARTEVDAQGGATFSLWLAEPGVSTAVMRGTHDNAGRELHVRCDDAGLTSNMPPTAVRCHRHGSSMVIEGSTDLATMLWRQRVIREVSVLTSLRGEGPELVSEPGMHLERASLTQSFDLTGGASAEVMTPCDGGFMGRMTSEASELGAVLTCGDHCENGRCEHAVGIEGSATRLRWVTTQNFPEGCLDLLGPGREVFASCREGIQTRLIGQIAARGYDMVLAVERTRSDQDTRRTEVWALVTRSARWQRLWEGQTRTLNATPALAVRVRGTHAIVCRGRGTSELCEQVSSLTMVDDPTVVAMN